MISRHETLMGLSIIFVIVLFCSGGLAFAQEAIDAATDSTEYRVSPSRWILDEQRLAIKLLSSRKHDVIVVPFQVRGHALDSTARSLMTLSLAHRIATTTDLSVADPIFVAKAFGSNARTFSDESITKLAHDTGATMVVMGTVGHDRNGKFDLWIGAAQFDGDTMLEDSQVTILDDTAIEFGDTDLPYYSFLERCDDVVQQIATEIRRLPMQLAGRSNISLPASVGDLEESARESALYAAHYLQFLGVLHPQFLSERARDVLFERSLVTLENVYPRSAEYRLLKARALLYLNRRPAALKALGEPRSPAEKALRAYIDGDLPTLLAGRSAIESPLLALIANLEGERLRLAYGGTPDDELLSGVVDASEIWGPILFEAFHDGNPWRPLAHRPLKLALDLSFPNKKHSLDTYTAGKNAVGEFTNEYEIAQLIIRHLSSVEHGYEVSQNDNSFRLGPAKSDFIDLIRNMLVGNVYRRIRHVYRYIGKAENAVDIANQYEPLLADHPALALVKSQALGAQAAASAEPVNSNLRQEALDLGRQGFLWTGRLIPDTSIVSQLSVWYLPKYDRMPEEKKAQLTYDSDWPRPPVLSPYARSDEERSLRDMHCLEYTIANFQCFMEYHAALSLSQDTLADADQLLSENAHRFIGHPQRFDYFARQYAKGGNQAAAEKSYRDAIDAGAMDWMPYARIGRKLAKQSLHDEALDVVQRYPGFYDSKIVDTVTLSNNAYEIASLFYWAGAFEAAAPLYEVAAGYRTGSGGGMASRVRLALIRGDYEAAIEATMNRLQRYQSKYAIRDLIGLASLMGDNERAWAIIDSAHEKFNEPELWTGALIAHRASNTPFSEIINWAFGEGRSEIDVNTGTLALRYVFLAHTIDRVAPETLAQTIRRLDRRPRPILRSTGTVTNNGLIMQRPRFSEPRHDALDGSVQQDVEIDRLLTMAAEALTAIEAQDFERAFSILDTASSYYNLAEFLPYYAWAAAKVGKTGRVETYLDLSIRQKQWTVENATSRYGIFFDELLAKAFIRGARGEHKKAIEFLRQTNSDVLHTRSRHIFTRYQVIEAARLLFEDTGEHDYREFALDLARKNTVIEPIQAWTHSFVAMLSMDKQERITALARATFLDPKSRCLLVADASELRIAREIAKRGYPRPGSAVEPAI